MRRVVLASIVATGVTAAADSARLEAWRASLAERRTAALLVVHKGRTALEWYAEGHDAARPQGTASLAKSLVGGMSLLIAWNDGLLAPDDPAARWIEEWRADKGKSKITLRHLATHSSGIEDAEIAGAPHEKLPGWKGAFWRREPDPFSIALTQAPLLFEPGTRFHYSNTGMAALAYAVTASLKETPQDNIRDLLNERLMKPLGIGEGEWSIGYGRAYRVGDLELWANWGGGRFTPRAAARIGALVMNAGRWQGRQLFKAELVRQMIGEQRTPSPERTESNPRPAAALGWYHNRDGALAGVPRDAFFGAGAGHELLMVVPSLDLVVVRNGAALEAIPGRENFWGAALTHVFRPAAALFAPEESAPPVPASPVIAGITFAPADSVVCSAMDSDNWPLTWGDDGKLYTAYGDGRGFEPYTDRKLSLGFASVQGTPPNHTGVNIRSTTGEREGDGANGLKASGLLMAEGVLYMWVRNAGNAQLAWSKDHARTWEWGFKFEQSFGSPAFLNFGKDNLDAPEEYVYTYSQDGGSAYEPSDGVILARVKLKKIRERKDWEFFAGLEGNGKPRWTKNPAKRKPVFEDKGRCERVDAVWHPVLRRVLLSVSANHDGAWGIYDAPAPWGPFTTAYHTEDWGLGPTHGYRLPSKWIDARDGSMWLVFSGKNLRGQKHYDGFCVRRMTLELR